MHESLHVENHRGFTEIYYGDKVEEYIKVIEEEHVDLFIIDKELERYSHKTMNYITSMKTPVIAIKAGEESKMVSNMTSFIDSIERLGIHPIANVCVIGGGTIQDLAATYLGLLKRGTKWIFIPTTLLSQADSCIGGKTSLNSKFIKNLYGLFHSPSKIIISTSFLHSLESRDIISGLGDALHYLYLDANANKELIDESLRYLLAGEKDDSFYIKLIQKCHRIKKMYIEVDEFDQSIRKRLNLGHSFGHALEAISKYKYPHGVAVLHGILHAMKFHQFLGSQKSVVFASKSNVVEQLSNKLKELEEFPIGEIASLTRTRKAEYIDALMKDKKSFKGSITLILLGYDLKPYIYGASPVQVREYIESDFCYGEYARN